MTGTDEMERRKMRLIAMCTALGAMVLFSAPASAAWQEYVFEDLGIAKEFPAEPTRTEGTYIVSEFTDAEQEVTGTDRPAVIYSVEQNNIIYTLTVADFQDKIEQGASIFGECIFLAEAAGEGEGRKVIANMPARVEPGAQAVYGRIITVDLGPDLGRMMTECFFTKGKLYKIDAHILPEHGDMSSPQAVRFINSLRFAIDRDYGEEDEAEAAAAYQYFLEHGVYPD